MTLLEFKKLVDGSKLKQATSVEQSSYRNGIKSDSKNYYFSGISKSDEIVAIEGLSWEEIYSKLPDWLKKTKV